MADGLRKAMVYLGLADAVEHEETPQQKPEQRAQVRVVEDETPQRPAESVRPIPAAKATIPQSDHYEQETEYRAPVTPIKRAPSVRDEDSELRQITTVHPRSYNDAKIIGENFRDGIPVIMNVTDMGETDAKRLVDFSAGLVFALHGSIERVTNKVFLLSPATVEVLGEDRKQSEAQATFFNQS
ncbi:cell division protein SepF [Glutamicibacter sp. MNS18]|uniref:cell division protein SepF n=1 Tax=Glutamicibacter sp. MNS18 TaxID=2989817 RepID=UPI0022362D14|nr:cell division protein SepF [Glutamicibacter sp. MNS18]MCW4464423.1 cell division protein SepF [Glutamicibacter sp. MNS18]